MIKMNTKTLTVIAEALTKLVTESGCLVEYDLKHIPKYKRKNLFDVKDPIEKEKLVLTIVIYPENELQKEVHGINGECTKIEISPEVLSNTTTRRRTISSINGNGKEVGRNGE